MEEWARLIHISNDHEITKEADPEFLCLYQRAILLALKETGTLDEMQYRCAEVKLKNQFRTFVKREKVCDNGSERRKTP